MADTNTGSIFILGTLNALPAILHVQRTALVADRAVELVKDGVKELNVFLENPPYYSSHAHLLPSPLPDLTLKVIWPATETHIKKYTLQERAMVRETEEVFERVVVPYIESFDQSRLEW